jgi:hypothetical protein
MKDHYDFSNGRKNPHAAAIKEHGYSITVHYSPEDVSAFDDTKDLIEALVDLMPDEAAKRLLAHIKKEGYDLPDSIRLLDDDEMSNEPVPQQMATGEQICAEPEVPYRRQGDIE